MNSDRIAVVIEDDDDVGKVNGAYLRRKIGPADRIETVRGEGYRLGRSSPA